ncbi:MAG: DUF4363 family protein [Oscillospiraceae bacterium]|jgi:hypothetical protein|nr:DUF4363 family protein [Oscillospiraceae bacterium]
MKREFAAAALLLAIFALSFVNVRHIETKTGVLTGEITAAAGLIAENDREGAIKHVKNALAGWLEWNRYSHIMLRHSEIDTITDAYYALLQALEGKDEVPPAAFGSLLEKLRGLAEKERAGLGAIL